LIKETRSAAIAKVDRTGYTYGIAAEPNRLNFRVWNSHGHRTTLPVAIPDAAISAVRFFAVSCGWTTHLTAIAAKRYILQQKCLKE